MTENELKRYKEALYHLANDARTIVEQMSNSRPEGRYYFIPEIYVHNLESLLGRLAKEFPEEVIYDG
jgi:hypothetical protein